MNTELYYKGKHLVSVERPSISGKIHLVEKDGDYIYRLSLDRHPELKGSYDFKTYQEALDILTVM